MQLYPPPIRNLYNTNKASDSHGRLAPVVTQFTSRILINLCAPRRHGVCCAREVPALFARGRYLIYSPHCRSLHKANAVARQHRVDPEGFRELRQVAHGISVRWARVQATSRGSWGQGPLQQRSVVWSQSPNQQQNAAPLR